MGCGGYRTIVFFFIKTITNLWLLAILEFDNLALILALKFTRDNHTFFMFLALKFWILSVFCLLNSDRKSIDGFARDNVFFFMGEKRIAIYYFSF